MLRTQPAVDALGLECGPPHSRKRPEQWGHAEPCGAMRSHAEPWLPAVLQDALITMSSDIYCFRNGVEGSHMTSDESSKIFGES
jgi:hypothetical protein